MIIVAVAVFMFFGNFGLIGTFAGVESRPIQFEKDGLKRSASIPGLVDQALEGMVGAPKRCEMSIHLGAPRVVERLGEDDQTGLWSNDPQLNLMSGEA